LVIGWQWLGGEWRKPLSEPGLDGLLFFKNSGWAGLKSGGLSKKLQERYIIRTRSIHRSKVSAGDDFKIRLIC
jgi:hypothetical protein